MSLKFIPPALVTATLALSACTSFVPSTLMKLNRLDPFTANPAYFAVLLDAPAGLSLVEDTTKMNVYATHSPSGQSWNETYILDEFRDGAGQVTYILTPDSVDNLRALQATLNGFVETSDGNGTGGFGISMDPCRDVDVALVDDPKLSLYVRFEIDGPFRPLVRDASVLEFFEIDEIPDLPQCGEISEASLKSPDSLVR